MNDYPKKMSSQLFAIALIAKIDGAIFGLIIARFVW